MIYTQTEVTRLIDKFFGITKEFEPLGLNQQLKLQKCVCFFCHQLIIFNPKKMKMKRKATKDHFIPRSHGHTLYGNRILLCSICNNAKGSLTIYEFIEKIHDSLTEHPGKIPLKKYKLQNAYTTCQYIICALTLLTNGTYNG